MAMEYETLLVEDRDGVRIITLNRPERINSFNQVMRRELPDCISRTTADKSVRAVIITGAGRGFCSGADLGDMVNGTVTENIAAMYSVQTLVDSIMQADQPVIAAVNGPAAGAGLSLALACDQIIASRDAFFVSPFIHGPALVPDLGILYLLPRIVGLVRAKEIMMQGERISAEQAHAMGMLNEVVDGDASALMDRAMAIARRLCEAGPLALAMTKRLLHLGLNTDWKGLLEYEALAQAALKHTEDHQEGVNAFLERRSPQYKGR